MEIQITVPDGKANDWEVSTFTVSKKDAEFFNIRAMFQPGNRGIKAGTYKQLTRNGQIVMSNTPAEIRDHIGFIWRAKKGTHILINGLGLGAALTEILKSEKIKSVIVIEKSKDVIKLVAPSFKNDNRVIIVNADAFEWKPSVGKRYDVVWHDIWNNICGDNLPEMTKLHRKYGRRTKWQGSWCRDLCKA